MNCLRFEAIVDDLARDRMTDAPVRERALAHAGECPSCRQRLVSEQALAADLRSLAEADAAEEAPLLSEAPLVAAFREARSSRTAPRPRWAARAAIGALAAALLLVAGLVVASALRDRSAQRETSASARPAPARVVASVPKPALPPPAPPEAAQPVVQEPASVGLRARATHAASREGQPATGAAEDADSEETEVTTEFLPLPYGDNSGALESGLVVRIRLPYSTLSSFGLPVNQDERGELVQADVLLGDDGLAHAIRFVR